MFCSNCGKELIEGSKYCNYCGNQVDKHTEHDSESKRKIVFDGKIHKCPNCGSCLDAFEHKCKDCGYELRGSSITNVVQAFAEKLERTNSIAKKNELISNFYIPNTKEDICEFFIIASSNLITDDRCKEAWKSKLEQTYHKAKLSFGSTPEFDYIDNLYKNATKLHKNKSLSLLLKRGWKFILGFALATLGLLLMIFGNFKGSESGDPNSSYHMLSFMGLIPLMFGIGLFIWGAEKKQASKHTTEESIDEEE